MHTYTSPPFFLEIICFNFLFYLIQHKTESRLRHTHQHPLCCCASSPAVFPPSLASFFLFHAPCLKVVTNLWSLFYQQTFFVFFPPTVSFFFFCSKSFLFSFSLRKFLYWNALSRRKRTKIVKPKNKQQHQKKKLEPLFLFCVWGAVFLIVPPITQRKKGVRASSMAVVVEQQR